MRLLTNSRYGTRLLLDIAVHGREEPVLMRDSAKRLGISQKYLEKIARQLKNGGYLTTRRGPNGGHMLAVEPSSITVGEVVRLLEGGTDLVGCGKDAVTCTHAPGCLTRLLWKEASLAMYTHLDKFCFGELVNYAEKGVKFGDYCVRTITEHPEFKREIPVSSKCSLADVTLTGLEDFL
ncbi:Rrf2 family transcriptional regulator [Desulfovibrio mangrovi]|uniref:RrF2 family transcriptional regulator n=1 Tax=Desulfovibrio mangrovi TaxID=2976983 RepID=UPI002245B055|nr:Rrf2 family transcriptional regulator [Desulfovibrio mangrovi]UZP68339.1 Rrf2 family transcriptional regulator [Desulfovibrio mangrovi]